MVIVSGALVVKTEEPGAVGPVPLKRLHILHAIMLLKGDAVLEAELDEGTEHRLQNFLVWQVESVQP